MEEKERRMLLSLGKLQWMKFYPGDWLKDPSLSLCQSATRGVWMDLLCAMHESGREGMLRGTAEQLARIARTSPADLVQALTDLQATGAADVTQRNDVFTVTNRRMSREAKRRVSDCLRKRKERGKFDVTEMSARCHASVTPERLRGLEAKTREVSLEPSNGARVPGPVSGPPGEPRANAPSDRPRKPRPPPIPMPEIPDDFDMPEFREAWEAFLRHRREKKNPMTPTAAQNALTKLLGWGYARALDAVRHSTEQGWTGIYERNGNYAGYGKAGGPGPQKGPHHARTKPTATERGEYSGDDRELPTLG